ncbi:small acid-soluble spore protein Tlp [Lysinibacillus yapensis]|uniref:Small acid-soluble spore protein Tlp n=1 Tax=Ureibacillus yapensis TaxID=2304605 RepID=A0A396S4R3_9BACL|nr:small acid-soluble spore protein Tlp [Lysinibacillus yapensis]RHW34676.1 small acid-soluble spore protein Tlp [Lysinibacillus yapensis]
MPQQQPKPDDRSNNVERLHEMIENTKNKLHEAEISLEFSSAEDQQNIQLKNERRKQSIQAMEDEIQDEMNARKNGEI